MKKFSLTTILFVVLLGIVAVITVAYFQNSKLRDVSEKVVWSVKPGLVPQEIEHNILSALKTKTALPGLDESEYLNINGAVFEGDWVMLYGSARGTAQAPTNSTAIFTFIARKTSSGWDLIGEYDSEFCLILRQVPDSVLDPISKGFFSCSD